MARKKDIPRTQNPPEGDGHHITSRYMTASELAAREAAHAAYEDMLARQQAHEDRLGHQVIHQQQNTETALPALENLRGRMPSLQGVIEDTMDDIEMFT